MEQAKTGGGVSASELSEDVGNQDAGSQDAGNLIDASPMDPTMPANNGDDDGENEGYVTATNGDTPVSV